MQITVATTIAAPLAEVWRAYVTPQDIMAWNTASPDWHTTTATVDLRAGGRFSSRMEARDGSMGFDFAGVYTQVVPQNLIEYSFGDRTGRVEFSHGETTNPEEQQRAGWQAILDSFKRHVESRL